MNTFSKHDIELELHTLDGTFSHLRIDAPLQRTKLITSIDSYGQLVPVVVVPALNVGRYVLLDGYARLCALQKLKKDTIKAEVWECSEVDALLLLLAKHAERQWEVFEEAQALRELQTRYHLSQEEIAKRTGRTQSWICRRLALLELLSEQFIQAITHNTVSVWTATRVLAPMARAIPAHAEQLLNFLCQHSHSTRELAGFFKHYQSANKTVRENMVQQPELFFKAERALQAQTQAKLLKAGPEGRWRSLLASLNNQLFYLDKLIPQLFYARQERAVCQQLLSPLEHLQNKLNHLIKIAKENSDVRQDDAPNNYHATPQWQELSRNQPAIECVT